MLVDEGGQYEKHERILCSYWLTACASVAGYHEQSGAIFATPGIAEKGALDVRLEVSSPGGHSSVPPPHTVRGSSPFIYCSSNSHIPATLEHWHSFFPPGAPRTESLRP